MVYVNYVEWRHCDKNNSSLFDIPVLNSMNENHRHRIEYIDLDRILVQLRNMDIVLLYKTNGSDIQENDYHIYLMSNNNISHRNYLNEHNNNVHCTAPNDHDRTDNMYDVFVHHSIDSNDLLINFDGCVVDEMMKNVNVVTMNDDCSTRKKIQSKFKIQKTKTYI